jgi:aquaporin Z
MAKPLTEFIGTFFLVLTIGCTVLGGVAGVSPPLAIGFALMVMVYAGGHVSGAHYNPAVSLAVRLRGGIGNKDFAVYVLAQLAGAVAAAFVAQFLFPKAHGPAMNPAVAPAFVAELLCTFALAWVVLNVAATKATEGNSYFGLAIGSTVMVGAFSVGSISGGAFNPAVAVGATAMGLLAPASIWIHVVADLLGASLAAMAYGAAHRS